jgi:hypothetical protein
MGKFLKGLTLEGIVFGVAVGLMTGVGGYTFLLGQKLPHAI